MTTFIAIIAWALAVFVVLSCGYLLLLTLLSARPSAQIGLCNFLTRQLRFDVIVPAHNEHLLIQRTVKNLLDMDWPKESFRVIVVADNCTDDTAELAREAGAHVIERRHQRLRGKGYALDHAFRFSQSCQWADAVVVIDADSEASPNLLSACAVRIGDGAHAIQVHYGVREPRTSWRTRLMCIALSAFHRVRSRARERINVSCGIRGNGWCVTHALLKQVPYRAFSLAEDIEYGIQLGLSGYRVHYADEAYVNADMVSDAQIARTQRRRWEFGRFALIRRETVSLLQAAFRQHSAVCLDLACDLLVLPLSYLALNVIVLFAGAAILHYMNAGEPAWLMRLAWVCGLSLVLYVLRGWQLSGMRLQGLIDLARAPFFVAWKVLTIVRSREPLEWVRTKRRAS